MRFAVLAMAAFISFAAQASEITTFSCRTDNVIEDNQITRFDFQVINLGKKNIDYWVDDKNEDGYPVKMDPEFSTLGLNENFAISNENGNVHLEADGDGCTLTDVIIYKSSGYKRGYARVKDSGCGASPAYSTITCKVK